METQENTTGCPVAEYNFRYHKKYYEQLKASLEPFGIYLERVESTTFNKGTSFTVYSNKAIIWKKTASKGMCAHNFLYLNELKIKLYNWLDFDHESRAKLLKSLQII